MEHTEIVTISDLQSYADTRESEEVIPEYVSLLVQESVPDLTLCRIPYSSAVGLPGWDGLVETAKGYRQFVPAGKSYWEMGTGGKPQAKATNDFRTRTNATSDPDRADATYMVVTPHSARWSQPSQAKWRKRRTVKGWKEIKILDGVQLADWLREYPAIGKALLKRMGLVDRMVGLTIPTEHWENLQTLPRHGDPPLPSELFLVGRDQARQKLQQLFDGQADQLLLNFESEHDVEDFVASFLAAPAPPAQKAPHKRCLFIKDADTWLSMVNLRARHVLVAHPGLDLEDAGEQLHLAARKKGHAVVIPVSGAVGSANDSIVPLRNPSAQVIESVLMKASYSLERARELGGAGALSLAALKRHLRGMGDRPPYANWPSAPMLALASAIGRWSGQNSADKKAVEGIVGKSYGEWIEILRPESLRSDTPLSQTDEQWKVISRGESWTALGSHLFDADLERLGKVAVDVLGERNPKFDLPPERRFSASAEGKSLAHTTGLRRGLAETLALLGSKPRALPSCSLRKPEITAILAVRNLLHDADWVTWASLNSELPLLAEAAPDEFLDQVEAALETDASPFKTVFAQEGDGVFGDNYMTGLLWALETLAWSQEYLIRVVSLLGDLAAIDPGGNWTNRPLNSITDILLPWHPQTTAPTAKRKAAIEALLREHPAIGWKALTALLPNNYGVTGGTRKPTWQGLISPGYDERVTNCDYQEQVEMYAEVAAHLAASDLERLASLIDHLPDLPPVARDRILGHLRSAAVTGLSEASRVSLWESLNDLVAKHRKFHDAAWAMPADAVNELAVVAEQLAPKSTTLAHRRLFSDRDFDLLDEKGSYEEQQERLNRQRDEVVSQIQQTGGTSAVLEFARMVASPTRVGEALGRGAADVDADLLPGTLESTDQIVQVVVRGFLWQRYWTRGWPWVDAVPLTDWTLGQKVAFLTMLPFLQGVWSRAETILATEAPAYWKAVPANPWQEKEENLIPVVEKLLQVGRARSAFMCLYRISAAKKPIPSDLAVRILLAAVSSEGEQFPLQQHNLLAVIQAIQKDSTTNPDELFKVEWAYLSILDHEFGGVPRILEQRLADDPAFFMEVISLIYRSDKEKVRREATEAQKNIAQNAYRLLRAWRRVPGTKADGSFDAAAFANWVAEVTRRATESGHLRVSQNELGQTLPYAPPDPDLLWIHRAVAEALNGKGATAMRSGFTMEVFNQRGVHGYSAGRDELKIAAGLHQKADALENNGYHRFATAIRELAKQYERDAEREASRGALDD